MVGEAAEPFFVLTVGSSVIEAYSGLTLKPVVSFVIHAQAINWYRSRAAEVTSLATMIQAFPLSNSQPRAAQACS